jgi:putative SOS response-associated peptidase YedK
MASKPTFRDAVKARRCILPATSFVEWTGPQGSKTKHNITRATCGPLFLAGLWGSHTYEGERTESYTMVMQAAEGGCDMARFHNRQPVVLTAKTARTWLDLNADWREIMAAPSAGFLAFDPPEPVAA